MDSRESSSVIFPKGQKWQIDILCRSEPSFQTVYHLSDGHRIVELDQDRQRRCFLAEGNDGARDARAGGGLGGGGVLH